MNRRSVLLTLAALGVLVSVVGGVGLFAALTDSAATGTSTAESSALGTSADIAIASASVVGGTVQCNPFSENLATGPFTVSSLTPGYTGTRAYFCVANRGSQSVQLSLDIFEGVDVDFACTGDEAENGDASCGGDASGELSAVLHNEVDVLPSCDPGTISQAFTRTLAQMSAAPIAGLTTLSPGLGRCFSIQLSYPDAPTNPTQAIQQAQSDRFSWRYRFIGQA
jgi:hypothetical protein